MACVACRVDVKSRVEVTASAALWSAAIVGTAVTLEAHDEHSHHASCGHYRRWHEDRWVYFYEDRWEYFDTDSGLWYAYQGVDGPTAKTEL